MQVTLSFPRGRQKAVFLILPIMACYALAGLIGITAHRDPTEMDTVAYLETACQIRETGGVLQHIPNCFRGVYREATQHPLYLLALSAFAEQNVRFFASAKITTYAIGFIFLFLFFLAVKKVFGLGTSLAATTLVTFNATFLTLTTMVACESMLALFFILFWVSAIMGFKKRCVWLAAGFFASMTFLTKSIGILTLPIFFFTAVMVYFKDLRQIAKDRYFWGFFLVFFIFTVPLLARNIKVFGRPLYNNSSTTLWIDRWHDYYRTQVAGRPPTAVDYIRTHSIGQIVGTFGQGIFIRDPKMIVDGLKPFAFWQNKIKVQTLQGYYQRTVPWQEAWAFGIVALFAVGLWRRRRTPEAVLSAVSVIGFLIFVGWYSKVFPGLPPTRLLYPILFLMIIFASAEILTLSNTILSKIHWNIPKARWPVCLGSIFILFYLVSLGTHFDWKDLNLKKSYAFNPIFVTQLKWMTDHVHPGEKVMVGEIFMANIFYFRPYVNVDVIGWPMAGSLEELQHYIQGHGVEYGLLDLATVAYNMQVFGDYFEAGPKIGLRSVRDLPAPFRRIPRDPVIPPLYEIYEFVHRTPSHGEALASV